MTLQSEMESQLQQNQVHNRDYLMIFCLQGNQETELQLNYEEKCKQFVYKDQPES